MKRKVIILSTALLIVVGGGYLKLKDTNNETNLISANSLKENNLIGVYIEDGSSYTKVDQIPAGYTLNEEKSYCKIGEEKQDITITYDMNTKNLTIRPLTTKGTKCYLYFDEQKILLAEAIKRDNQIKSGTPDFSQVATTNEGVYKTEDDWGESYYFRGAVGNNWVKFAGYYWRIIRINGDGSIRLIYNGTSTATTGTSTQISTSAFNSSYNDNMYVGYMYASNQVHGLGNSSTIKGVLDNWYNSNLTSHADKISKEAGFCGDREPSTNSSSSNGSGGTGTTTTYYGGYIRLISNKSPNLKCKNSSDLYTVSGSSKGNKALSNPIGLITADEVAMAGGVYGQNNPNYYLNTDKFYWTMTPYYASNAVIFGISSSGGLLEYGVGSTWGVRPVINIANDVTIKSGNGTSKTPYEI